jgi:glycosyltransferase involved in cell wall biosynthesis
MSQNEQPLVSVLTPVYNGEAYLADCVESILAQTYSNFEYIIVNNCSKDGTLEIAEKYAASDSRIRVVTNKDFVGVIDNHNNAFNLMSPEAKYCKVVSGDDYIFPTCIDKMVELAEANPSVGLVGSYQLSGTVVKWIGFRYPTQVMSGREVSCRFLKERQSFIQGQPVHGFGSPTSLLYRADLVRRTRAFYPNPSPHSDTSACLQSLLSSDFGFVYEILCYERTHEETQTSASLKINRYLSASLDDLIQYGPKYLGQEQTDRKARLMLMEYHRFLATHYFSRSGSKDFWDYHRTRLQELGFPLKSSQLYRAAISTVVGELVNPGLAFGKLKRRLGAKRKSATVAAARSAKQINQPAADA